MSNLSIFNQNIRFQDNLYSLNDLHKASGSEKKHAPFRFIRNDQTKELIEEIERSPDVVIGYKSTKGGINQGTWVCKELVYAYAMWISAKFHLQVIRAFDAMTQGMQYDLDLSRYHFPLETASPADRQFQNAIMTPQRLLANRAPEMELLTMLENDGYNVDGVKVRLESLYRLAEYQAFYNEMFTELHANLDRVTQLAAKHKDCVWGKNINFVRPSRDLKKLDF